MKSTALLQALLLAVPLLACTSKPKPQEPTDAGTAGTPTADAQVARPEVRYYVIADT